MGSYNWVRDTKKGKGGKTFAVGVAAVVPTQAPKKRKLVWQRGEASGSNPPPPAPDGAAEQPTTATDNNEEPPKKVQKTTTSKEQAELLEKQAKLEALQQQIEQRKQALAKSAAAANRAKNEALEAQRRQEEQKLQRKNKLEAAFSQAFSEAKASADAEIANSKTPIKFADEEEVKRVLSARNDYDVLQLQPGADAATVRRRYREMAVSLHPDKCKTDNAAQAFNRLVTAYQQLHKYAK